MEKHKWPRSNLEKITAETIKLIETLSFENSIRLVKQEHAFPRVPYSMFCKHKKRFAVITSFGFPQGTKSQ